MNGARTPRSAISSSTVLAESRSLKSRGSASEGLSSGLRPQYSRAKIWGSMAMQRLNIQQVSRRAVCAAVVALGIGAAVSGAFAAARRGSDVIVIECHGNHLLHLSARDCSQGNLCHRGDASITTKVHSVNELHTENPLHPTTALIRNSAAASTRERWPVTRTSWHRP